jgi:chromosome segregation ATPase
MESVVRQIETRMEAQEGAILTNNRRLGEAVQNSLNAYNATETIRRHIAGLENRLNTIDLQNEQVLNTLRAQDGTLENISDMIQGLDGRVQEEMDSREESYHTEHSSQVPHTPSVRSESPR